MSAREALRILASGGPSALTAWKQQLDAARQAAAARLAGLPGSPQFDWEPAVEPYEPSYGGDALLAHHNRELAAVEQLAELRRRQAEARRSEMQQDLENERLEAQLDLEQIRTNTAKLDAAERYHPVELAKWARQEQDILGRAAEARLASAASRALEETSVGRLAKANTDESKASAAKEMLAGIGDWVDPDSVLLRVYLDPSAADKAFSGDEEATRWLLGGDPDDVAAANETLRNSLSALAWGGADTQLGEDVDVARAMGVEAGDPISWLTEVRSRAAQEIGGEQNAELFALLGEKAAAEGVPFVEGEVAPWANALLMQRAAMRSGMDERVAKELYPYEEGAAREEWEDAQFQEFREEAERTRFLEREAERQAVREVTSALSEVVDNNWFLGAIPLEESAKVLVKHGVNRDQLEALRPVLEEADTTVRDIMKNYGDDIITGPTKKFVAWTERMASKYIETNGADGLPPELVGLIADLYYPLLRRRSLTSPVDPLASSEWEE